MSAVEILTQLQKLLIHLETDDYVQAIAAFDKLIEYAYDSKPEIKAAYEILESDIKSLTQREN